MKAVGSMCRKLNPLNFSVSGRAKMMSTSPDKRLPAQFLRLPGKEWSDLSSYQRMDDVMDVKDGRIMGPTSIDWKKQSIQHISLDDEGDLVMREKNSTPLRAKMFSTSPDDIKRLPAQFLRLSCKQCYDLSSFQRADVVMDDEDGRPLESTNIDWKKQSIKHVTLNDKNDYVVEFGDGTVSDFSYDWVQTQLNRLDFSPDSDVSHNLRRIPWSDLSEDDFRSKTGGEHSMTMTFDDIVLNSDNICEINRGETNIEKAMKIMYQSGILLVTSTPVLGENADASIAALGSALSGSAYKHSPDTSALAQYQYCMKHNLSPRLDLEHGTDGPHRTLFGKVWSTHSCEMLQGSSTADSAYGNDALPLHTDMTYYRDPPGLQIFSMVSPADQGGESTFSDGLAVAEHMRKHYPKEFDVLCRNVRRYRSIDSENGWYLEANGPVIQAIDLWQGNQSPKKGSDRWGPVVCIRHNDLDRLPDLPPINMYEEEEVNEFYTELRNAHQVLDSLLRDDKFRLVVRLQPGDTVVLANQRCLHGRKKFTTLRPRSVKGCYVSQDDLESRMRWMFGGNCTFQ